MEPEEIIIVLKPLLQGLSQKILMTPTGERRNSLARANTLLMEAEQELYSIAEWEGKEQGNEEIMKGEQL